MSTSAAAGTATKNIGLRGVTVADTRISLVDGERGRLFYRGYAIAELAARSTYEEVVYLLLLGSLPGSEQLAATRAALVAGRALPRQVLDALRVWPRTARPMDVLQGMMALLAGHDPTLDSTARPALEEASYRAIAGVAMIVAAFERLRRGLAPVEPDRDLAHGAAFLMALTGQRPSEDEARLMDLMLILHAEHSLNASTFAAREVASTRAHLYASLAAAIGALSGMLHGGANARVMEMLEEIGDEARVEPWVRARLAAGQRVMGLGHAVYRTVDPRAGILKELAERVLAGRPERRWFDLSLRVERVARAALREAKGLDLYPNVDFYSGAILRAFGLPNDLFPPFFAVGRVAGWCAHVLEEAFAEAQPKAELYRPEADYVGRLCGPQGCRYVPLEQRGAGCPCGKPLDACCEEHAVGELG